MMPSNKNGDLATTVLELSNGLCVMQCDLSGQVMPDSAIIPGVSLDIQPC